MARKVLTAEELESMTPAEQDAAFGAAVVTDLGSVPAAFLERVRARSPRVTRVLTRRASSELQTP